MAAISTLNPLSSDSTLSSGATISHTEHNTHRTNYRDLINNLLTVVKDLEDNYASNSTPTDEHEGKVWCDTTTTPASLLKYYKDGSTNTETLVGLTLTQTLTNKTLTFPTITGPTITGPTITGSSTLGNIVIATNDIGVSSGGITLTPAAGSAVVIDGGASFDGDVVTGIAALTATAITGTLQTAAQSAITSVGTLTGFTSTGIDDNASSTAITIDSSGNVGIGTTSPEDILHIVKSQDGETTLLVDNQNAGTSVATFIRATNGANDNSSILVGVLGTGYTTTGGFVQDGGVIAVESDISGGLSIMTRSASDIRFYTNGHTNERMRIDSSGNVGIGTAAPDNAFANYPTTQYGGNFIVGANQAVGAAGQGSLTQNAYFDASANSKYISTDEANEFRMTNGNFEFYTAVSGTADDTITWGTTKFKIANDGNVGIQETTPSKALDIKNGASGGDILCYDIYTHDGGVETSDERLKENIFSSDLGLDFINSLNPVSYKWRDVEKYQEKDEEGNVLQTYEKETYTRTHYGMIAQEVEQAILSLGKTTKDFAGFIYEQDRDRYGLRYKEFISPIIKAIQDLTARIESLEG